MDIDIDIDMDNPEEGMRLCRWMDGWMDGYNRYNIIDIADIIQKALTHKGNPLSLRSIYSVCACLSQCLCVCVCVSVSVCVYYAEDPDTRQGRPRRAHSVPAVTV